MTTADRVDPISYRPWLTPGVLTDDEDYTGKHRRPGLRRFSLPGLLYTARHRQR